jgi:hypothetical protein
MKHIYKYAFILLIHVTLVYACCSQGGLYDQGGCSCIACERGYKCPSYTNQPIRCTQGTYQSMPGQTVCIICPRNTYCNGDSVQIMFEVCTDDLTSEPGSHECSNCLPTHYQINGANLCLLKEVCTSSQYQDITIASSGVISHMTNICHVDPINVDLIL